MVFAAALELYGIRRRHRVVAFIILVHWFLNPRRVQTGYYTMYLDTE